MAFADRRGGTTLRGLRVQDFVVTSPTKRLVAGYFVQAPPSASDLAVLELQARRSSRRAGVPRVQRCALADGTVATASLRLDRRDEPTAMQKRWAAASEQTRVRARSGPEPSRTPHRRPTTRGAPKDASRTHLTGLKARAGSSTACRWDQSGIRLGGGPVWIRWSKPAVPT